MTQIGLSFGSLMVAGMYDMNQSYQSAWILLLVLTAVTFIGWMGAFVLSRKYCKEK